ncbi:hypothetical protein [Cysteiniphilum marinum]|nr:hypothetical protein [Cysteiniphilum marinum]
MHSIKEVVLAIRNRKIRRLMTLFGLSISSIPCVYATGYPVVDLSSIMGIVQQTQQSVDQFDQSIKEWTKGITADIEGKSGEVDALNNGFANSIVRQTQAQNDVFNNQLRMQMQPSSDACSTYSVSDALNDAMCDFIASVGNVSQQRTSNFLNQTTGYKSEIASQHNAKNILDQAYKIADKSPESSGRGMQGRSSGFGDSQGTQQNQQNQQNQKKPSERVVRADILLGSQGDTYDALAVESTKTFNDIIVGAAVAAPPPNNNQGDGLNYVDNYLRPTAIRAIAANSLDTIRALRVGGESSDGSDTETGKPSVMQLMQKFADDRFGTPDGDEWIKKITNTQESADDFMSDSAVLRSIVQMQAYSNSLDMMRYQSQLRMETIQAALLVLKNKEVYGN